MYLVENSVLTTSVLEAGAAHPVVDKCEADKSSEITAALALSTMRTGEASQPSRKIRKVDAGNGCKRKVSDWEARTAFNLCDKSLLHSLSITGVTPQHRSFLQGVKYLFKISVADIAALAPQERDALLNRCASFPMNPMEERVVGVGEDVLKMPFMKFLHLPAGRLNECLYKVHSSLLSFVVRFRALDPDCSMFSLLQLLPLLDLNNFSREVVQKRFSQLSGVQIDAILPSLSVQQLELIRDEQLSCLKFDSASLTTLRNMFPGTRQGASDEFVRSKLRFRQLSPDQVNAISGRLFPTQFEFLSDTQLQQLEWSRIIPGLLKFIFPTDSDEVKKESARRINILPPDKIDKILGILPKELLSLINNEKMQSWLFSH